MTGYALWLLHATTGLRRGVALAHTWAKLEFEPAGSACRRRVCRSPTGGELTREDGAEPLARDARQGHRGDAAGHRRRQAAERLALGPGYEDHGLVSCRKHGTALHPEHVSPDFRGHVESAGLPRIPLKNLCHTYAWLALQAGVNPKVVSERLGHATVSFTLDTYSHVLPGIQEDAAARVAALVRLE